jgi:transposase
MARRKTTKVLGLASIKEILRLKEAGLSCNKIAQSLNISRATAQDYVRLAAVSGLSYELVRELEELEVLRLIGKKGRGAKRLSAPDWNYISQELSRKGVTLSLLWQEYRKQEPAGYSYSNYCLRYRHWQAGCKVSMRQVYKAGEKAFADYSGMKGEITDPKTGEISEVEIFVMALGASNLTYVEAQPSQSLSCWIGGHVQAFEYFGGVTELVVPDNLKSGVSSPCRYEPEVNRSYAEFAEHYGVAVVPARVRKPQDKAKVEEAVQNVERQILAAIRNQAFYSLAELNIAIKARLEELNSRKMQVYGCSRWELFKQVEQAALKPLPKTRFELGSWKVATVNIDYHIEIGRHYYSVPYQFVRQKVEVRFTESVVTVFANGKKIAQHLRSDKPFKHTTVREHMPPAHQFMQEWTPTRLTQWGAQIGEQTKHQVEAILGSRTHPEQAYRSCLGLLRLANKFGKERLEAACQKANSFGAASYKTVDNILRNNADKIQQPTPISNPIPHANLRGGDYYN